MDAGRLTPEARRRLTGGQASADREAGIDWADPDEQKVAAAGAKLAIDLDDANVWELTVDRRRALARRLGLDAARADDLSRFALASPQEFAAEDLRSWRIGSDTWLALTDERLGPAGRVERPVGVPRRALPAGVRRSAR